MVAAGVTRVNGRVLGDSSRYDDEYFHPSWDPVLHGLEAGPIDALMVNDSWFGEAMAPWQHLQIARLRALENGRWFIRATNSGISAFIAPDGSVAVQNHKLYAVDLLRGSVTPRAGETPYARLGDAPLWWGSALLLLALFVVSRAGRDPPTTFAKP